MSKFLLTFIFLLTTASSFISCAAKDLDQKQSASLSKPDILAEKAAKADWELEWDKTLDGARKEGKLVLYTSFPPPLRQAITDAFKKRTGLITEAVAGRGNELAAKVLAERRAGLYMADVSLGGSTTDITQLKPSGALRPIMPELFLHEVLDTSLWFKGALPFMDKEKMVMQYRFTAGGSFMDVAFRPDRASKVELASWHDLLNPKYKGKMNLQDPTAAGKGGKWVNKALTYFGLDWDYMRALARQEPFLIRDIRLQIEWVVQGKHLLAVNPDSVMFEEFQKAGATIDSTIFKETRDILGGGFGSMTLFANPPHPNAARLFVNWFLSKEGMTLYSRTYEVQSARLDTPTDHLPEFRIRKPNVDYPVETEGFILQEEKFRPMIMEIFGPLLK